MNKLKRGIIVSCQAAEGEVFYGLGLMKYFAKAALEGGAVAIRSLENEIADIKAYNNNATVIGLVKKNYRDSDVYITPTIDEIDSLLKTGCEVIALDATQRTRPNNGTLKELIAYIRENSNCEILADIATIEDALYAQSLGFDYISTTLRGYTAETKDCKVPDMEFIEELMHTIKDTKIIVEGGIWDTNQVEKISMYNPYAIVIGTSITRPFDITKRFVSALKLG